MKILTQDKAFFPVNWTEKFEYLKKIGFDGFEIDGQALVNDFDLISEAVEKTKFPVSMICGGYQGWIGDFNDAKRLNGIKDIERILYLASKIGAKGIVVPAAWGMFSKRLPPMTPPRSEIEDQRILLDSLTKLNEIAMKTKTTIYLEPLNRYEDYMLNRTQDAAKLIIQGRFSHVLVCYDFFHMNIEEPQMDTPILKYDKLIGHIHLASNHRYQPGSGHLDYQKGLKALVGIDYKGLFAIECRVEGDNPALAYETSLSFMREEIKKAGF